MAAEAQKILCDTYGEEVVSVSMCEKRYRHSRNGDFDVDDRPRSGRPKETDDGELQALLNENSAVTTLEPEEARYSLQN